MAYGNKHHKCNGWRKSLDEPYRSDRHKSINNVITDKFADDIYKSVNECCRPPFDDFFCMPIFPICLDYERYFDKYIKPKCVRVDIKKLKEDLDNGLF